jgi:hypothetical protein
LFEQSLWYGWAWWWLAFAVFVLCAIGLVVKVATSGIGRTIGRSGPSPSPTEDQLHMQYSEGRITREEYLHRLADLPPDR